MGKLAEMILGTPVATGTLDIAVPPDVLERVARRVEAGGLDVRRGARTHVVLAAPADATPETYRAAASHASTLRIVALGSSLLQDVRLTLEGGRLRYDVRFPRRRWAHVGIWAIMVMGPAALVAFKLTKDGMTEFALSILVGAFAMFWFLASWEMVDLRESVKRDLTRVVGAEVG